jgi:ribosomal protein S18 acetylase RimI-like enzyme
LQTGDELVQLAEAVSQPNAQLPELAILSGWRRRFIGEDLVAIAQGRKVWCYIAVNVVAHTLV